MLSWDQILEDVRKLNPGGTLKVTAGADQGAIMLAVDLIKQASNAGIDINAIAHGKEITITRN